MPWYYAGPEAKPVGPISLDELHARCLSGALSPETYVIERTGQPNESLAWKPYREFFPASPSLPPLPPVPPVFTPPVNPPLAQPHPLFPSAAPVPHSATTSLPSPALPNPHYYPTRKTNTLCAWGFGLGLVAFFLSFACGVGLLPAIFSFPLCIIGLMQVHKNREQVGQLWATAGLLLSGLALLISFIFILVWAIPLIKQHEQTTTEQTSNNSE